MRKRRRRSGDIHTAGLNIPPLTSAKIAAVMARAAPNAKATYISFRTSGGSACSENMNGLIVADCRAICVPAKARNRNMKVPMNSPRNTASSFLSLLGFRWALALVGFGGVGGSGGGGGGRGMVQSIACRFCIMTSAERRGRTKETKVGDSGSARWSKKVFIRCGCNTRGER